MKCFKHPNRFSVSFCQDCGRWFCAECLHSLVPAVCRDCASRSGASAGFRRDFVGGSDKIVNKSNGIDRGLRSFFLGYFGGNLKSTKFIRLISAASLLPFLIVASAGYPLFFGLSIISVAVFFSTFFGDKGKMNKKNNSITDAQVYSLIDRYGRISVPRLLGYIDSSTKEAAEKKLKEMAVQGKLDVDLEYLENTNNDFEIYYKRKSLN